MNFRIHTILYFATGIAFIALETIGVAWISIAVKALIIPLLIWLYLRFVRGHWNRFHSLIITALVFSWIGDMLLQLTQFRESFFLVGLASFLITQLIYMVAFMITPGRNILFFRKIYLLVLAGAILFVLSDSMIAINRFTQPFELARIAIMSSYITAQYLIAIGCTRQFNLTLK